VSLSICPLLGNFLLNVHGAVHFTRTLLILELWRYADIPVLTVPSVSPM
jgi:hypothetical protein